MKQTLNVKYAYHTAETAEKIESNSDKPLLSSSLTNRQELYFLVSFVDNAASIFCKKYSM